MLFIVNGREGSYSFSMELGKVFPKNTLERRSEEYESSSDQVTDSLRLHMTDAAGCFRQIIETKQVRNEKKTSALHQEEVQF